MDRRQYLDAAETAFFERELEYIKVKTYDIKYPGLFARRYVPVSNEAGSGATEVTYRQYDRFGRAKIVVPGSTDAPRVDVKGTEFTRPTRTIKASYGWDLIELRQSIQANKSLDSRRASACRRAIEEVLDEVASLGAPAYGIPTGFLNNANVAIDAAAGAWSAATGDAIVADVAASWRLMASDTKGVERADTLLLPDDQHALISTKRMEAGTDTTVLEFILKNFRGLAAIEPWYRLDGAGVGAVDRAVLYRRSPDHLQQEINNEFEQLPVFQRGSNFEVECLAQTAGTTFYYPRSARYIDGI